MGGFLLFNERSRKIAETIAVIIAAPPTVQRGAA
jgi:hypothetical protein